MVIAKTGPKAIKIQSWADTNLCTWRSCDRSSTTSDIFQTIWKRRD